MSVCLYKIRQKSYLLAETDPGTCTEGKEYEGVWNEVPFHSVIKEPVGIKLVSWWMGSSVPAGRGFVWYRHLPSGPQRSFRRCMMMGAKETLVFDQPSSHHLRRYFPYNVPAGT